MALAGNSKNAMWQGTVDNHQLHGSKEFYQRARNGQQYIGLDIRAKRLS
jgi:hypothetical protein